MFDSELTSILISISLDINELLTQTKVDLSAHIYIMVMIAKIRIKTKDR